MSNADNDTQLDLDYLTQIQRDHYDALYQMLSERGLAKSLGNDALDTLTRILAEQNARLDLVSQILLKDLPSQQYAVIPEDPAPRILQPTLEHVGANWSAEEINRFASNLYPLEETEAGTYIRWTGPELRTDFELPISRGQPISIEITTPTIITPRLFARLSVVVDGHQRPFRLYPKPMRIVVDLPKRTDQNLTEVSLFLPSVHSPEEVHGASDDRLLGIAISNIALVPRRSTLRNRIKSLILKIRLRAG